MTLVEVVVSGIGDQQAREGMQAGAGMLRQRHGRWRWVAGMSAFALLILVMSCAISLFGVGRGMLPPIEFTANLGKFKIITVVTDDANCWRPIRGSAGPTCSMGSIYQPNWYYIAWIEQPGTQQRPRPSYRKLFVVRLETR